MKKIYRKIALFCLKKLIKPDDGWFILEKLAIASLEQRIIQQNTLTFSKKATAGSKVIANLEMVKTRDENDEIALIIEFKK